MEKTNAALAALDAWQVEPDPARFPYDEVVASYHRVGKHFVAPELLEGLDRAREALPQTACPAHRRLARFLSTALDKFDGRYDNPSYLALEQLSMPGADEHTGATAAAHRRDRLLVLLMADMMRVELAAAAGQTDFLPEMRPEPRVTMKRCRHGLRAARPALERLGMEIEIDEGDPIGSARRVCCAVLRDATPDEHRTLQLTALPVSLIHDEYMFFRVLQSYEITFALAGVLIREAVTLTARGRGAAAARSIEEAGAVLGQSSALFSLVGTMRPDAFLAFREFTDGASAIQSRSYKRVESVCRRPDSERFESPAYESVPDVRDEVAAGLPNVDDAMTAAHRGGLIDREECGRICVAKKAFEDAVFKWRKTHVSIAAHMLGERRGTGYTEGVSYLEAGKTIPVFASGCPVGHATRAALAHSGRTHEHLSPRATARSARRSLPAREG